MPSREIQNIVNFYYSLQHILGTELPNFKHYEAWTMEFGGSVPPQVTLFKKEHSNTKNGKNDLNQVIFLTKSCDLNQLDLHRPTLIPTNTNVAVAC